MNSLPFLSGKGKPVGTSPGEPFILESFDPPKCLLVWRPSLAFLHQSVSSAVMISKPPWLLLGSVQDTPWSALSNGRG